MHLVLHVEFVWRLSWHSPQTMWSHLPWRAHLSELVEQVNKVVAFKNANIAAGSQAVRLPFMLQDPRV